MMRGALHLFLVSEDENEWHLIAHIFTRIILALEEVTLHTILVMLEMQLVSRLFSHLHLGKIFRERKVMLYKTIS